MNRWFLAAVALFIVAVAIDAEGTKNFIVGSLAFVLTTFGKTLYDVICRLLS